MPYKLLGGTGLRVAELALGIMTFGSDWGWGADKDESRAMFDAYAGAGWARTTSMSSASTSGTPTRRSRRRCAPWKTRSGQARSSTWVSPTTSSAAVAGSFLGAVTDRIDDHRGTVV